MLSNRDRRLRRLAILTGGLLVGSVMYVVPASAGHGDCDLTAGSFVMPLPAPCTPTDDLVHVTGAGAITFDLTGGDFETSAGDVIVFELDLTGATSTLTVQGTDGRDRVDMGSDGVNLNGSGDVEVVSIDGTSKPFETQFASVAGTYTVNGEGGGDDLDAGGLSRTGDPLTAGVTFHGGPGADVLDGGDGIDTLNGGLNNDRIDGREGADFENGDEGRDTFTQDDHANGGDVINGGPGSDLVDYGRRINSVSVTVDGAADDGEAVHTPSGTPGIPGTWATATGETDNVQNVERVNGSEGNDRLDTSLVDARTILRGDEGDDTLTSDLGNDRLFGDEGSDILSAGAGRDRLQGGDGDDFENGGLGRDVFDQEGADNGADEITGDNGFDTVSYSRRDNTVNASITSGAGDDGELNEGDTLNGIRKVIGGSDDDTMSASGIKAVLVGRGGDDELTGGAGQDVLRGGSGNDDLFGGDGNDRLFGNAGNDNLDGGPGNRDVARGGSGNDTCTTAEITSSC